MKICWNNLKKLEYRPDRGHWQDTKWKCKFWIYKESCRTCRKPFLSQKKATEGLFCCKKCSSQCEKSKLSKSKKLTGRKFNQTHKTKISLALTGLKKTSDHKRKLSITKLGKNNPWFGKKRPEHSIKMSGKNHPNWQGGISSEPYCLEWKFIRVEYKEYDNNKCQNPYCKGEYTNKITSHHIDYNKKNCKPNNIITLCVSCNTIANHDRNWWQAFYTEIKRRKNDNIGT